MCAARRPTEETPLPPHSTRPAGLIVTAALLCGVALPAGASSKDVEQLRIRSLAATCAHCHGTDGHAVEGEALIRLAGLPQDYIFGQLMAFRTGQRPATIMHQITRGYSQEQLETIAHYFAHQPR
jgi:cytochrome subunit of sulfide dehydrogenase